MDSLLIAVAVGVVIWLLMRRAAQARLRRQMAVRQHPAGAEAAPPGGQKSMPRFGAPGTITRGQMAELRALEFEPMREWSKEEAQLILDTVVYFRAVIFDETGDTDPPHEVQNTLLGSILTDEELREAILEWSLNRTREEEESGRLILPRDETYERVADEIAELWEAGTGDE